MTTTPTKTELKKEIIRDFFSTHLVCVMWPNYPGDSVVSGGGGGGGGFKVQKE